MATIKDVAKEAGVSVATVSRVLNRDRAVTAKTAAKVKAAIKKLDYSPNMLGNSLRKSQTKNILVLVPTLSNQFYSKILRGMELEAAKEQYNILICMMDDKRDTEEKYLSLLKTKLADGAVFLSSTLDGREMTNLSRHYPVVQCGEYVTGSNTPFVSIDNEKAGYDATLALIHGGHRNIAFVGSNQNTVSSEERKQGYFRALRESHLPIREENIILDSYSFKSGMRSALRLIGKNDSPTAVFAVADSIAIGLMRGLHDAGYRVPQDMAVIGCDDIAVASFFYPALSTISQPQFELGKYAVRLLLERIQRGQTVNRRIILEHSLIFRETI